MSEKPKLFLLRKNKIFCKNINPPENKILHYTDFYTLSKCVTKCVILRYFVNNVKNSIFKTTSNISFSKTPSDFYYYKYRLHLPVTRLIVCL